LSPSLLAFNSPSLSDGGQSFPSPSLNEQGGLDELDDLFGDLDDFDLGGGAVGSNQNPSSTSSTTLLSSQDDLFFANRGGGGGGSAIDKPSLSTMSTDLQAALGDFFTLTRLQTGGSKACTPGTTHPKNSASELNLDVRLRQPQHSLGSPRSNLKPRPPRQHQVRSLEFSGCPGVAGSNNDDFGCFSPEVDVAAVVKQEPSSFSSPSPPKRVRGEATSRSSPLSPGQLQHLQRLMDFTFPESTKCEPSSKTSTSTKVVATTKPKSKAATSGVAAPRRKRKSPNNGVKIHRVTKWQREKRGILRACLWELRFWRGQITELSRRYDIPIRTLRRYKRKSIDPLANPGANDNSALKFHTFPGESIPRPPREVTQFIPGFTWHAFEGDEPFPLGE